MKQWLGFALVYLAAAGPGLYAQARSNGDGSGGGQSQPAAASQSAPAPQTPAQPQQQTNQNPFPEDTSDIPVIPTGNSPAILTGEGGDSGRIAMPEDDSDPVRTPEGAGAAAEGGEQSSSSSLAGMSDLLQPSGDETQSGKRHRRKDDQIEPEHQETAAEDENVGKYYLDNHDWKAALSRYQSALVLDPYNPDVYWGLAECERGLGQFAEARANYEKVVAYDPGSRHAKDAKKVLRDPQIANAKLPAAQPNATQ